MKRHSPAAERNRTPIFEVLNPWLPAKARVLEVASGSGQHAAFICEQRPDLDWQPTDIDPMALESIRDFRCEGMKEPVSWSVMDPLPEALMGSYDGLVNINMIHIAPWAACENLMKHASQVLSPGGILFLYGPFLVRDRETAPSNQEFDLSLRSRNPLWGLRELDRVAGEAAAYDFRVQKIVDMPANNLSVILQRLNPSQRS